MTRTQPAWQDSPAEPREWGSRWPWVLLGLALLVTLVVFTRAGWAMVLILPVLLPYCMAALVSGLSRGEIEPWTRYWFGPFQRERQPIAYWLSVSWNAALLAVMLACFIAALAGAPS